VGLVHVVRFMKGWGRKGRRALKNVLRRDLGRGQQLHGDLGKLWENEKLEKRAQHGNLLKWSSQHLWGERQLTQKEDTRWMMPLEARLRKSVCRGSTVWGRKAEVEKSRGEKPGKKKRGSTERNSILRIGNLRRTIGQGRSMYWTG